MTDIPLNKIGTEQNEVERELDRLRSQEHATKASEILARVAKEGDIDRMLTGANLINAFNYAIQQQAKREEWNGTDYQAFCIALAAMDQIK